MVSPDEEERRRHRSLYRRELLASAATAGATGLAGCGGRGGDGTTASTATDTGTAADPATGTTPADRSGGSAGFQPAAFVVRSDGETVRALDGDTGELLHEGDDPAATVQAAVDEMAPAERLVVRGPLTIGSPVVLDKSVSYEHYGVLTLDVDPGDAGIVIGTTETAVSRATVRVSHIRGRDRERDGVRIVNGVLNEVVTPHVTRCRYAYHIPQRAEGTSRGENKFRYVVLGDNDTGFYLEGPPDGQNAAWAEGNQLHGGAMFGSANGVVVGAGAFAGGIYLTGVVDNLLGPEGATDYVNRMDESMLGSTLATKFIREDACEFHPDDVVLNPNGRNATIGTGRNGQIGFHPDVHLERTGPRQLSTNGTFAVRRDAGEYGGGFESYEPPAGHEGALLVAEDHADKVRERLYVHSGGSWRYADLHLGGPLDVTGVSPEPVVATPGETVTVQATLQTARDAGTVAGQVDLETPDGWTAESGPQAFELPADAVQTVTFPVAAANDVETGGDATVVATVDGETVRRTAPVYVARAEWTFEDGTLQGWEPTHHLTDFRVEDGILRATSTGGDPYTVQGETLDVDASAGLTVHVEMAASVPSPAAVFWGTASSPGFSSGRRATFSVDGEGMDDHYVPLDVGGGTVRDLRLDPLQTEGEFRVEAIRLVS